MKTHRSKLLIVALALFGVATVASADHRDHRHKRYDGGERLRALAHRLDREAARLFHLAERTAHHGGFWEARALDRLYDLEREARHFHKQVERRYTDPGHLWSDFRDLRRAYFRAQRSLEWAHSFRVVDRAAYRVGDLLEEVRFEMTYLAGGGRRGADRFGRFDDDHAEPAWSRRGVAQRTRVR